MRKIITLSAILFTSLSLLANGVEIKGIHYLLNEDNNQATVTFTGSTYEDNSYLGSITIPAAVNNGVETYDVTVIGENAFRACAQLTAINLPNSITKIDNSAFEDCIGLTNVTLPNSITVINGNAFMGCSNLVTTIPTSVANIGIGAFRDCSSLKTIHIPATAGVVREGAFRGCSSVTEITVDPANYYYDSRDYCSGIILKAENKLVAACKNTLIPTSVTEIATDAFADNTGLKALIIPDNVITVGPFAFSGCTNLETLVVPSSWTSLPEGLCSGCTNLRNINIPSGITAIEGYVFNKCKSLQGVTLPAGVLSVGYYSFASSGITSIELPDGLTTIDYGAFVGCESLTDVRLPRSLTTISDNAFTRCKKLMYINIPRNIAIIGKYAFYDCPDNIEVNVLATTPPALGAEAFPAHITIAIPCGTYAVYAAVPEWAEYDLSEMSGFELKLSVNNEAYGFLSDDGGIVCQGSNVVITAYANNGYEFEKWSDGNTDNPRTISVYNDMELQAIFKATGSDVETVENAECNMQKFVRDGHVYIMHEGRVYNVLGTEVH